jgi:anti-sigma B factor antagonist
MAALHVVASTDTLTHIALSGRLDVQGVHEIELKLTSHTTPRKRPAIVDLSEVEFIGSLGIGMLLTAARALRNHGVGMVLLSPQNRVEQVLRASSIDQVIPITSKVDDALQLLGVSP